MTDKELLEYAAKAAGYIIESTRESGAYVYLKSATPNYDGEYPIFLWNPLDDDGDALRLAVKLKIGLLLDESEGGSAHAKQLWDNIEKGVLYRDDPYAATRRAIVRAAAEMGRVMP